MLKRAYKDLEESEISTYQTSKMKDLLVLFKNESSNPAYNSQRYVELDIEKSLVWNLQEQTLIEHPIITIIHRSHANFFLENTNLDLSELFPTAEEKAIEETDVLNFDIPEEESVKPEPKAEPEPQPPKPKKSLLSLVSYASSDGDD